MFVYNPLNFDPLSALPAGLRRYADDARYFVHKIFEHRVFDHRSKDDFVPLKSRYMMGVMSERHYTDVRDALISSGIVESDHYYVKGQKSIGYRLAPEYRNARHQRVEIQNKRLVRKILKKKAEQANEIELDVHRHLYRFLLDISVDYEEAVVDIDEDFASNELAIAMIRDGYWFFHTDDYGRVHTNVANLKSSLRRYLRYQCKPLHNIDIRNSQPLFLAILLLVYFANKRSVHFYSLPSPLHPLYDLTFSVPDGVRRYVEVTQRGDLYDLIASRVGATGSRKEVKRRIFGELLFCRNKPWQTACEKVFAEEFPEVYEFIRDMKRQDYTHLSKLLQKTESAFVVNGVVRECMEQHPDMFVTTIHDSVMTTEENVSTVVEVIRRRFACYGIVPELRVE